jgi:glycosyltransferase involved in cell wall biosynthesis
MSLPALYFNGKFYAAGLNGVHRVADRLIREVDRLLGDEALPKPRKAVLLLPKRRKWEPRLENIELREDPRAHSQAWEQLILPWQTRDGVLVNLCNLAPILHPRKLLLLHDAQFLFPDSGYPFRLRTGYRLLTPWMARTSRAVATVSTYSRDMLDLLGVVRRERSAVVYNGADHILETPAREGALSELGLAEGGYALHFASAKGYKNTRIVLEAFRSRELANLRLLLVGADQADLERAGLTPPPNAVFAGRIDDATLRAFYERALCLVFPSRTEGFGLPPVEAMMCGCPVVVSPAGAIPEVCGDAALYAGVDDPADWVAAVCRLRDIPALRMLKSEAGKARAGAFNWASAGRALYTLIAETAVA